MILTIFGTVNAHPPCVRHRKMAKEKKSILNKRLVNAYLSSVISISLVLLLVGIAGLLLLNAKRVSDYFKENMKVSVMMKPDVTEDQTQDYALTIKSQPYSNTVRCISKEQGIAEMKELLGEDFLDVFESSPIPVSVDLTLKAGYVSTDSLTVVKQQLESSSLVAEVIYQSSLVDKLNANLSRISMVLGVFILLLLFISFVLINNTVRLNIHSRRFSIHTMRLVGATKHFIRAPFMIQAVFQGLMSGLLATLMLSALLFAVKSGFAQLFAIFSLDMMLTVMAVVVVAGVLICLVSTFFVVNKLVSLRRGELYY